MTAPPVHPLARAAARIGALQTQCAELAYEMDRRRQPEAADLASSLAGELHALRRELETAAIVDAGAGRTG